MRNKYIQMSLFDIYNNVSQEFENNQPNLIKLLDTYIDFDELIPNKFKLAFYKRMGRSHKYHLESFIRAIVFQTILGINQDSTLINLLKCSKDILNFTGFDKIPDASQFTRFKEQYCEYLSDMFNHLVDITEPICREIDSKKADYLIYDTTGIELPVKENNPKFYNNKLNQAKFISKPNPESNPYSGVYGLLPKESVANPIARLQYINGHFCYAAKVGILCNGLGIPRQITFLDDDFRKDHPEISKLRNIDNPNLFKEISDAVSLKPALMDFFNKHSNFHFNTFIGDAAFDSFDIYSMLKSDFKFTRACIPINKRGTKEDSSSQFNEFGTPICPIDKTPFTYEGKSKARDHSLRFKWVCHKSIRKGSTRICTCETPCTDSKYGRCVYTYPDKNFRLYPGIARNTEHWDNLYQHRVVIERTINIIKDTFCLDSKKTHNTITTKANLYIAGICQLFGVILAKELHKENLYKSIKKLIA